MAAGAVCMAGAARMAEVADGPVADMLMDPTVDMAVGMVACPTCLRMFGFLECCLIAFCHLEKRNPFMDSPNNMGAIGGRPGH